MLCRNGPHMIGGHVYVTSRLACSNNHSFHTPFSGAGRRLPVRAQVLFKRKRAAKFQIPSMMIDVMTFIRGERARGGIKETGTEAAVLEARRERSHLSYTHEGSS